MVRRQMDQNVFLLTKGIVEKALVHFITSV